MELAEIVVGKPMKSCLKRILQRLFDGVISNFFLNSFDSSTQWIQCKDRCKGFSVIYSRDSMQRISAKVGFWGFTQWLGTWPDSGDSPDWIQCRGIRVVRVTVQSTQGIQCNGSVQLDSVQRGSSGSLLSAIYPRDSIQRICAIRFSAEGFGWFT